MGRWTLDYHDDVLRNKLKTLVAGSVKRAKLEKGEPTITYEAFVEELDEGDAFTSALIDVLVKEMAERRTRPNPDDRRQFIAERTAKALSLQASSRIYQSRQRRRFNFFDYAPPTLPSDDEEDSWQHGSSAPEGVRINTDLYDAYAAPSFPSDTELRHSEQEGLTAEPHHDPVLFYLHFHSSSPTSGSRYYGFIFHSWQPAKLIRAVVLSDGGERHPWADSYLIDLCANMIKKRNRPPPNQRHRSIEHDDEPPVNGESQEEDAKLDLSELIELRKLRRARLGIDATRLTKGDEKKKKKRPRDEDVDQGGLQKGAEPDEDEDEAKEAELKARRSVRTSNFTQQTNTLDVDKHMMAYIEENMKLRRGTKEEEQKDEGPLDPYAELFRNAGKAKAANDKKDEEGNVTNSLAMLTAIPEVDLGMDARLKNIEETEKAKRAVAEERKQKKKSNGEEHLTASRFYQPNLKAKSDADILRDAKLEAMGFPPEEPAEHRRHDRVQMATDEMVMERFKKRMRK
ncbi:hypothetical protein EUX98_g708 [Antrodiella citrinella]|uniref:Uncharacterized protein n=1 Tax=Antrodiella citrinella TaxID=2447956 RepID=A0A4S4N397_9APHY|nr:hypothetical protein EUX98_g708 [Antrodiella citrinella]